jgi:hypothetical protein
VAAPKTIVDIPLAAGLATKDDPRAMSAPGLSVCEDVQFDELGGIQTRPQFQAITDAAGNTIADIRKLAAYGDELVAFSKDKFWSYAGGDGLWTQRAEYLAVKVEEQPRFVTTAEQFDCDRAELGGVTMYCWSETTPSGTSSYVAAIDTLTGSVKLAPTSIKSGATRPRLMVSTNKIFLLSVVAATPAIWVRAYDPSDLSSAETSTTLSAMVSYDVVVDPDTPTEIIVAVSRAGTGYTIANYTETPAVSGSVTNARTSDGAISVASTTGGTQRVCVTYSNGTALTSDILDDDFADVSASIAVATLSFSTLGQVTNVHGGDGKFYLFWTVGDVGGQLSHVTLTDAGSLGTEALMPYAALASHAFLYDSNVYVWSTFAETSLGDLVAQLQNSYFLLRYDFLIAAKAVAATAAGDPSNFGALPTVALTAAGGYSWCGAHRRIIPLGQEQSGYSARSLTDITATFDSDEARRTALLGETLYISGGFLAQYDGANVTEAGFHVFPHGLTLTETAGSLTGTFNWKASFAWTNAKGETERTTTTTIQANTLSTQQCNVAGNNLTITAKQGAAGEVAIEYWRQIDAAPVGAPFYLVTSKDPAVTGVDNSYIENVATTANSTSFIDDYSDAVLISKETFPENGGLTLASLPSPAATIVVSTQDRLIVAGVPGNPHRVVYSKLRGSGEVAAFNDALFLDLPPAGGKITAIDFLNETMIVFKETAIYAVPGDGFDNNGGGQNYGPARLLDSDVGAISAEGVVLTPKGLLFKSSKGWFLLNHGWQASYIGSPVDAYDSDTIVSCEAMASQHQVRCVSSARTIVWDYLVNQWGVWTTTAVDAVMWDGTHHLVNSAADGVLAQASTYDGAGDLPGLDIETGWIKLGQLQGFKLVRRILILGEYLGAHDLRVRVAYNYNETASGPTWVDDKAWTVSPTTVNGPLQVEHGPSRPKCESIKIRITAQAIGVTTHPITQALNLTGLSLEVALRKSAFAGLPAAQKQ